MSTNAERNRRYRARRRVQRLHEEVHRAALELRRFWRTVPERPLLVRRGWLT